jgi:hypothetical protein
MAGTEWQASTGEIDSTAGNAYAASLDADDNIGFIVKRISISINAGTDTGNADIRILKHDGDTTGTDALVAISTGGDADTPQVGGFDNSEDNSFYGMANQKQVAAKYWPVTSQSACVFDFNQMIGRPLKINGGDGILVQFKGAGTNAKYVITFEGEE